MFIRNRTSAQRHNHTLANLAFGIALIFNQLQHPGFSRFLLPEKHRLSPFIECTKITSAPMEKNRTNPPRSHYSRMRKNRPIDIQGFTKKRSDGPFSSKSAYPPTNKQLA
jgi:hypothetical protein